MASSSSVTSYGRTGVTLTGREVEVLTLVLEGRSSKEVAHLLYLSKRTIDSHLAKIYEKLNVSNRVQAIRRATELGIVSPHTSTIS